jgi:hypothetical protein
MSSLRSVSGQQAHAVWRVLLVLAVVVLAVLALSGSLDSLQTGVLTLLPAVVLAVMMLTRPYLGEQAIARLRARCPRRRRRPRTVATLGGYRRPELDVARGGRLIAAALAGRAPPLARAGCR